MIAGQKGHKRKLEVGIAQKRERSSGVKGESNNCRRPLLIKRTGTHRHLTTRACCVCVLEGTGCGEGRECRLCDKGPGAGSPVSEGNPVCMTFSSYLLALLLKYKKG